jgi:hypothetical protein
MLVKIVKGLGGRLSMALLEWALVYEEMSLTAVALVKLYASV